MEAIKMGVLTREQKYEAYLLHKADEKSNGSEECVPIAEIAVMLNTSPANVKEAVSEMQDEFIRKGYIKLLSALLKNVY